MNLNQLKNVPGSRKRRKRRGCGTGSGHGKTSCRGHKGQHSRSGSGRRMAFEGGQNPLYRRLPKRGFNNIFRKDYGIVNIDVLNKFPEGAEITPEDIYSLGIVKKDVPIKILGRGILEHKLGVTAHKFSRKARELIEKAGGNCRKA